MRSVTPAVPAAPAQPAALTETAPPPAATTPVVASVDNDSRDYATPLIGLLAAIGLGSAGMVMLRRRRATADGTVYAEPAYDPVSEPASDWNTPVVTPVAAESTGMLVPPQSAAIEAEPVEPVIEPAPAAISEPAYGATSQATPVYEDEFDDPRISDTIPTGEARQALLDKMVAAEPDEANPFRSSTARRRRARLILQKREHDQAEAANSFDWRSYSSERTGDTADTAREREITEA